MLGRRRLVAGSLGGAHDLRRRLGGLLGGGARGGLRLLLGFGHHLFPGRLGFHLLGRLRRLAFFFLAARLAIGVHVVAGLSLHTTDLVLIFRDNHVAGVGLALGTVRFHLGPDIVYVV